MPRPVEATIRTALVAGFGLTFGIWLLAGYYFTTRVSETEGRAAAINARYTRAQDLLSTVRAQILLGSIYVRDALLDPHPSMADYARQFQSTYDEVHRAMRQYVPLFNSEAERERVTRLQRQIDDFHSTMLQILSKGAGPSAGEARILLQTQIVPKRQEVIRLSEEVEALNRAAFVQQQSDVADIYRASQRRLWTSVGAALIASFGVALIAALYTGRLETRIREQRARDAQSARDLQHLSAKLITAQEEERRTIARELHDEVGQVLTAIKVELAVAERALEAQGGSGHLLEDARVITEGALTTVRDLSHLLHPALLDDLGLPAAVEWYTRGFAKRHHIRAEVVHDPIHERFAPELEASAYRIIQEALTNVVRHADANACTVFIQRLATTMLITVEDDGVGFDEAVRRREGRPGLGLVSVRERAAQLQGTVRLESAPGKGTRLTVELPVPLAIEAHA